MSCPTEHLAAAFPSLPAALEDHVAACARCADAWSGYRALADLVAALPRPEPASQLAVRRARKALVASARLQGASPGPGRAWTDRAARRRGLDRAPRRLAGLAAAAVLVAAGSLLSSPLGPGREGRVAGAPRPVDPPVGPAASGDDAAASLSSGRARPPATDAARPSGSAARPGAPAPSAWAVIAPETWPESIQAHAPPDGDGRRLTIHELRERWAFIGIAPPAAVAAGSRTAPRAASPAALERPGSGAAVAAGRIDPGRLPGVTGAAGGDGPGQGSGDPAGSTDDPSGDRPDDTGETCDEGLARRFGACLSANGLDPAHPDESEEGTAIARACWQEAGAEVTACCAETPDASCATDEPAPSPGPGQTCADVLFGENDRCLADHGVDQVNPVSEADLEIISYCWIDVANGFFDACCAATPDATCP